MRGLIIASLLLFNSFCLGADQTLSELVDQALSNHPDTQRAWWNAKRAAAAVGEANSRRHPTLTGAAGADHARDYRFPGSQEVTYTSAGGELLFSYLLFDGGDNRASIEAARAAFCAAGWEEQRTLQRVMARVLDAAYEVFLNKAILDDRLISLQDQQEMLKAVQDLQSAGLRSSADIVALNARLFDMRMSLVEQRARVDAALGKLAVAVGCTPDARLSLAGLPDPLPSLRERQSVALLIQQAQQTRGDLAAKRAAAVQKQALIAKARSSGAPRVRFDGDAGYKHYWHDKTDGVTYRAALRMEVPLYRGFEQTYLVAQAAADAAANQAEYDQLLLDIAAEVQRSSVWIAASQEIWELAEAYLGEAKKSYEGFFDKYKAGTQGIFELTEAHDRLLEARIKHSSAKIRWYQSLAELSFAVGTLTPFQEVACEN